MDQRAEQLDLLRHALRELADLPLGGVAEAVRLEQLAPAPLAPFGERQAAQRAHEGDRLVGLHRRVEPALLGQVADLAGDIVRVVVAEHAALAASGSMMPSSIRSVVVLPAPLGPSTP